VKSVYIDMIVSCLIKSEIHFVTDVSWDVRRHVVSLTAQAAQFMVD